MWWEIEDSCCICYFFRAMAEYGAVVVSLFRFYILYFRGGINVDESAVHFKARWL